MVPATTRLSGAAAFQTTRTITYRPLKLSCVAARISCSARERHVAHIALFHLWKEDRGMVVFPDDPTSGCTLRDACRDYIEAMAVDSDEDDQDDDGDDDET